MDKNKEKPSPGEEYTSLAEKLPPWLWAFCIAIIAVLFAGGAICFVKVLAESAMVNTLGFMLAVAIFGTAVVTVQYLVDLKLSLTDIGDGFSIYLLLLGFHLSLLAIMGSILTRFLHSDKALVLALCFVLPAANILSFLLVRWYIKAFKLRCREWLNWKYFARLNRWVSIVFTISAVILLFLPNNGSNAVLSVSGAIYCLLYFLQDELFIQEPRKKYAWLYLLLIALMLGFCLLFFNV